jgi:hypothetical protein
MGKKKGNQSAKTAKPADANQEAPPDELGIENMAPGQDSGSEEKAPEMSNGTKSDEQTDNVQAHPPTARHTDIHEHADEMKAAARHMEENEEVLHDCSSESKDEGEVLEVPTKQEEAARIEGVGADDPANEVSAEYEEVDDECVVELKTVLVRSCMCLTA